MFALFGVYLGSMPMRFGVLSFVWVCQLVHLTICQAPDDGPDVFEGEAWVYFGGWFNAVPLIVRRCDIQQALPPDVVVTQPLRVSFLESEMRRHRKNAPSYSDNGLGSAGDVAQVLVLVGLPGSGLTPRVTNTFRVNSWVSKPVECQMFLAESPFC